MRGHDAGAQQRERPSGGLTSPETQPSAPRPKAAAAGALRHERPPRSRGPRTERAARPPPPRARRPRRSERPLRLRRGPQHRVSRGHAGPVREPRGRPPRGTKARPRFRAARTGPGRARAVNDGTDPPRLFIAPSPRRAGGVVGRRAALGGPAPTRLRPRRGPTDAGLSRSRRPRAAGAAPRGDSGPLPSPPAPRYLLPALSCCSAVPPPRPRAAAAPPARRSPSAARPAPRAAAAARQSPRAPPGRAAAPRPCRHPAAHCSPIGCARPAAGSPRRAGANLGARRRRGGSRREGSEGWHAASGAAGAAAGPSASRRGWKGETGPGCVMLASYFRKNTRRMALWGLPAPSGGPALLRGHRAPLSRLWV